jgi:phosphoribosylamine--glycine ligase
MKVLVVGSGGREHTLTWKIAQSRSVDKIYCAPGNGGMSGIAELVTIKAEDIVGLMKFAQEKGIDLTIVGPEVPLVAGIVDAFHEQGLRIFGPSQELANLEGSKVFAKTLMTELGVPTAAFKIFDNAQEAKAYIQKRGAPLVVKADGLCAGKGVIVCKTVDEALAAIGLIMEEKTFGSAGDRVIIEDCLVGEETSIIVLSDGKYVMPFASSQDHKAVYDGDQGPNTGGMGAYSPAPVVTEEMFQRILAEVIDPIIGALARRGKLYKGVLYAGLMITAEGPKVLEFNVRFGDPETQAIFPRLKNDIIELMQACIDGTLGGGTLSWDPRPCVSVVVASGGYPGSYEKGKMIHGLEDAEAMTDVVVFHAGTKTENRTPDTEHRYLTNGGRVLNVTALGVDIKDAIARAYRAIDKITFENMYYRRDIGHRALAKVS